MRKALDDIEQRGRRAYAAGDPHAIADELIRRICR
jgi:hypothetical protein